MLKQIPDDEQGKGIKTALLIQYEGIRKTGITYALNGTWIPKPESHFDFENTIIDKLQALVDLSRKVTPEWVLDECWVRDVGGAQKLLPVHVVYEYCSRDSFHTMPDFTNPPTRLRKQFYIWEEKKHEDWFHAKLGVHFAISQGNGGASRADKVGWRRRSTPGHKFHYELELDAIKQLYAVRTADLDELGVELGYQPEAKPDSPPGTRP